MKFDSILKEKRMVLDTSTRLGKKYNQYKGLTYLVLGEKEPPDVHGIPKKMEAYGRGGFFPSGEIFIDGGPSGSAQGHPTKVKHGFYWAADYDAIWTGQDGKKRKGVMYIKGRLPEEDGPTIEKNIVAILELIFKRLPRP